MIFHLPDETCDICGREIAVKIFRQHWEVCDGDVTKETIHTQKILQFWVEVLSDKDRVRAMKGLNYTRKGRCVLCPGFPNTMIPYLNFHLHMESYHLPAEPCTKCHLLVRPRDRKKHMKEGRLEERKRWKDRFVSKHSKGG